MKLKEVFPLAKRTVSKWIDDNAPSRAASLSYYTIFSLAPLLVIAVAIAGMVFGREAVQGQLQQEMQGLVGGQGAGAIQDMMVSASKPGAGVLASSIGVVVLLVGATGAFVELQDTLNVMWQVDKKKTSGVVAFVRARALSFAMIGLIAFFLLVSLGVSAALAAVGHVSERLLPGGEIVAEVANFVVSFLVITALFAAIFKVLPDTKVAWREVWLGASVTSLLFSIGKLLIGLYIGKGSVASSYGAAGSFAVLLIWIYYSSMILFLGAEFTQVYATERERVGEQGARKAAGPSNRRGT